MLNYINWSLQPEIFKVSFDFLFLHLHEWGPRWYGVLFAMSFICGYYLMLNFFNKEGVKQEVLDSLTIYMFLGTLIGARLGHCLFYEPAYYFGNPIKFLAVWQGGLASHGAAIGIVFSLYLFARKHKKKFLWILDRIAIVVALSGFFIRTGNLMNSEIYGHVTDLPWGFIFELRGETLPKHPTQLYEGLSYLVIFIILFSIYRKNKSKVNPGILTGLFFILIFGVRFLVEFVKENQVNFENKMALNMGQILSIPLILIGIALLVYGMKHPLLEQDK